MSLLSSSDGLVAELPVNLRSKVLSDLSYADLTHMSQTNKRNMELIQLEVCRRYEVKFGDWPSSAMSFVEIITVLNLRMVEALNEHQIFNALIEDDAAPARPRRIALKIPLSTEDGSPSLQVQINYGLGFSRSEREWYCVDYLQPVERSHPYAPYRKKIQLSKLKAGDKVVLIKDDDDEDAPEGILGDESAVFNDEDELTDGVVGYITDKPPNYSKVAVACGIPEDAFKNIKANDLDIRHVHFPDGLKIVKGAAFYACDGLNCPLYFPKTLEQIEEYAFLRCKRLTGVIRFPKSLKHLGYRAFAKTSITGVEFPNDAIANFIQGDDWPSWPFDECHKLVSVHVPASASLQCIPQFAGVPMFPETTQVKCSVEFFQMHRDHFPKCTAPIFIAEAVNAAAAAAAEGAAAPTKALFVQDKGAFKTIDYCLKDGLVLPQL